MSAIHSVVKNRRIEATAPADLPDGTPVVIIPADDSSVIADESPRSPEEIKAWLEWYESVEPLIFTEEEKRMLEADRLSRKELEKSQFDEQSEKLRRMWE